VQVSQLAPVMTFTRGLLASLMVVLVHCARWEPGGPAAPVAKPQEIYVDSIAAANPIIVTGRARTFENTVSIRVRDAGGRLIAETHTTSAGEMGRHNPYEAAVWIVHDPGERVTVEAFEYSAKDGSVRSLASRTVPYGVPSITATLVFPAGDCTQFGEVSRRIPKSIAMARLLTEALVRGPSAQEKAAGATSPFPQGSEVRSVILRNGVVTVDFNERLQNVGGACAATAIRESVVRTLRRLPAVKDVAITAGGSRELALQP
jgi:Immunoglobulin-like domain of bacterial spore germination/Sporulation and spore germination